MPCWRKTTEYTFRCQAAISMNGWNLWAFDEISMNMCTLRWKLKLVGAGFPSATHFRVTLSPSTRGSWAITWRAMFSVKSVHKIRDTKSERDICEGGGCIKCRLCPRTHPTGDCREGQWQFAAKCSWGDGWIAVIFWGTRPNNPFKAQCFCSIWDKLFAFLARKCSSTDKFYFKGHTEQVTSIFNAAFGINPTTELQNLHLIFQLSRLKGALSVVFLGWKQMNYRRKKKTLINKQSVSTGYCWGFLKEFFLVFAESLWVRSCCWCSSEKPSTVCDAEEKTWLQRNSQTSGTFDWFSNSCQLFTRQIHQNHITVNKNMPTLITEAQNLRQHHCFTSVKMY